MTRRAARGKASRPRSVWRATVERFLSTSAEDASKLDLVSFPIIRADQLPPLGTSRETSLYDFKVTVADAKPFEFAKDVAAFANASGGTLLIGAREHDRKLGRYEPLNEKDAADTKDAYGRYVTQRCSPVPMFDVVIIPKDGGFIVAVNVWPFPGQPVGAELRGDKVAEGHGGKGYRFPMRVGVDTIWISPEQLPMLMVPEVRRVAILLDQIPAQSRDRVQIFWRGETRSGTDLKDKVIRFLGVQVMGNVALFENTNVLAQAYPTMSHTIPDVPDLHVPLDAIGSVWRAGDGEWCLFIHGSLKEATRGGLAYFP